MARPKKIGVLVEKHFDETEYVVFNSFFPHKGYEVEYMSYLWGAASLTFEGNDFKDKVEVKTCVSKVTEKDLEKYAGIILIGGYAMDRLRYEEQPKKGQRNESEAVKFLRRCVASKGLKVGTICHSMWLFCAAPDLLKGRKVTCANNIVYDVLHAGGDVQYGQGGPVNTVVDGDIVSGKHPGVVMEFVETYLAELVKA